MSEYPEILDRIPTPIDHLEAVIADMPKVEFPVENTFTPGIYTRKTTLPAGSVLTSMRHLTDHQFIILEGEIEVRSEHECVRYSAPYHGITKSGTKRALLALKDTVWLTIHANPDDITDLEELAPRIIEENKNPLLPKDHPRLNTWREQTHKLEVTT